MTRPWQPTVVAVLILVLLGAGCSRPTLEFTIGECVNLPDTEQVADFEVVDCEQTHTGEVFALPQHPAPEDAAFPGAEELTEFANERCLAEFEEYVGTPYDQSEIYYTALTPSPEAWDEADGREIVCLLVGMVLEDGSGFAQLTGSKRNSNE